MTVTGAALIAERYRLVRPLGEGGMGRVWLARDEVLGRDVAIKEVVPPPGLTDEERRATRERSLREARAIARLNHPGVVRIYDVVHKEQWPWIVMEYVPSRSLEEVIAADGPLPVPEAARIGGRVLEALRAAHRVGMLHRDVKPGNVLLADDGRVVLTDFGLATVEGDPSVTRSGLILGSPAFIAPERARDGVSLPESDLWSLGATIFAAVEGQSPYARSSAMATLAALASEDPDPAPHAGALRPLLSGLLRKDPAARLSAERAAMLLHQVETGRTPVSRLSRLFAVPRPRRSSGEADRSAAGSQGGLIPGFPTAGTVGAAGAAGAVGAAGAAGAAGVAGVAGAAEGGGDAPTERTPIDARTPERTRMLPPAGSREGRAAGEEARDGRAAGDRTPAAGPIGTAAPNRRRTWAAVAAVALVIALVTVTLVLGRGGGPDDKGTATASGTATRGTGSAASQGAPATSPAGPASSGAAPATTKAAPPAPTPGSGEGASFVLPTGWSWYTDPTGFKVAVPGGWTSFRHSNYPQMVYFQPASGGLLIGFDHTDTPKADPVADWRAQAAYRGGAGGDLAHYQEISIRSVPYRTYNTADWEFRYTNADGVRTHVIDRGAVTVPQRQAYGIWWSTPDNAWSANLHYFDTMMRSFQPAPVS